MAQGLKLSRNLASSSLMWFREALRKPPRSHRRYSGLGGRKKRATICPMWRSICSLACRREIHFEVVRGAMQMGFDITLKNIRRKWISFVARGPGKDLVPQLGILAVEIDKNNRFDI